MERTEQGLEKALSELPALYDEFQKDLRVTGDGANMNQTLEKAGRVDDFFQLGMLMCRDALERRESCGGHFRAEYQDDEGEAKRDDENFAHVAAWEWTGDPMAATRNDRTARVRSRPPRARGATSERTCPNITLTIWRQTRPGRRRSLRDATRSTRSATRRRSSRCSTCSTSS